MLVFPKNLWLSKDIQSMAMFLKIIAFAVFVAVVGVLVFRNTIKWALAVQKFYVRMASKWPTYGNDFSVFEGELFLYTCRFGIVFFAVWLILMTFSFVFGTIYITL